MDIILLESIKKMFGAKILNGKRVNKYHSSNMFEQECQHIYYIGDEYDIHRKSMDDYLKNIVSKNN